MKGTLLNTATVTAGAVVGLALGKAIPDAVQPVVMNGLGLVTILIGVKMGLESKNPLTLALAVALGGLLGTLLGFQRGLESFANWAEASMGGGSTFAQAIIVTSILFCVGPMTLLGCIQDGTTGKSDLLALKSTLDGIGAIFFAAALGPGVLVTAGIVLVFQGALTLLAKHLKPIADDAEMLAEVTGAGGAIMLATGCGLAAIRSFPTADYLPALAIAPLAVLAWRRASLRNGGKGIG